MTESEGGAGQSGTDIGALIEALDRRARQAGTEGASTVLRGMVATITEVLGGLEDRLDKIEQGVAEAHNPEVAEVRGSLAGLHDRIERLEEAFVRAVESSTEGSDTMLGEIRAAIEAAAPVVPDFQPPDLTGVEDRLGALAEGVHALEERVAATEDGRHAGRSGRESDPEVLAGISNLADVVGRLEDRIQRAEQARAADPAARATQETMIQVQAELARLGARLAEAERDDRALDALGELRAAWEAGHDRLDRVLGAIRAHVEVDGPADSSGGAATTSAQLREIEAAIERLSRNDSAGRLIGLVEARLSSALDAMVARAESAVDAARPVRESVDAATGRLTDLTRAVDDVAAQLESLGARVERETVAAVEGVGTRVADRLSALADQQSRDLAAAHDTLRSAVAALSTDLRAELGTQAAGAADTAAAAADAAAGRVVDAFQRETELLTQRIAALGRAVEALRTMLEDHVRRTENTFGRRAGEMGRRLAVDFGLRSRPDDTPEPTRELGRGS